jgi:hypothetical protein
VTAAGETVTRDLLAELTEMRRREQAATAPPWTLEFELCDCGGENGCACGQERYPYAIRTGEPHVTRPGGAPNPDYDFIHSEICELTHGDAEFIAMARTDMPRLLAALDAVLKPHQPGRITLYGSLCEHHENHRYFSIDRTEADHVRACPDCSATVYISCAGCGPAVSMDQCPVRSLTTAALTGEEGDQS